MLLLGLERVFLFKNRVLFWTGERISLKTEIPISVSFCRTDFFQIEF